MQKRFVMGAVVAGLTGLVAASASAQEAAAAEASVGATSTEAKEDSASEGEQDPMGWIGIGLKLGAGGVGGSEMDIEVAGVTTTVETESRAGFQLSVPINMGGDGFGWMLEPYMNFDDVTAYGLYTGPTFNFHVIDPLYVGFGFGLKFAYLSADALDIGLDIGGRVPITGTYYLHEDVGLIAELGLGYTTTGMAAVNPTGMESDISFGSAFAWDFSVGARWP